MPLPENLHTFDESFEKQDSMEQALILMVSSVSHMGISLSKLIETEACEIKRLAAVENDRNLSAADITLFNKSVQRILKKICMLQMLLQIKLEYIGKLVQIYPPQTDAIDGVNTPCPRKTHGNADFISEIKGMTEKAKKDLDGRPDPIHTVKAAKHCLMGRGHGQIQSREDPFFHGIAILQVYLDENGSKDNFLCYTAMKDTRMMNFTVYPDSLVTELEISSDCKKMKIEGIGSIIMKERFKPDKRDMGSFELTVGIPQSGKEKNFFEMIITAAKNSDFNQMSGKIEAEASNLQMNAAN